MPTSSIHSASLTVWPTPPSTRLHFSRVCFGQGLALMEAKVALAMILHRFSFEISPSYQHSPVLRLTLTPKHGMPLLLSR
ncbi:hypothetical protein SELMODRAFT_135524, partial [Selaginella moellendorffii]